jgi:hypothetical protein
MYTTVPFRHSNTTRKKGMPSVVFLLDNINSSNEWVRNLVQKSGKACLELGNSRQGSGNQKSNTEAADIFYELANRASMFLAETEITKKPLACPESKRP